MAIPIVYNLRNLRERLVATVMTIVGIGLVTSIFVALFSIGLGLQRTLVGTGDPRNMIILRKNATETQSEVTREQAQQIESEFEGIERDVEGKPLVSRELVTVANVSKKDGKRANVAMRGVGPLATKVRDGISLVPGQGRWFEPNLGEVVAGKGAADRFKGLQLNSEIEIRGRKWKVVGVFEADGQAYESEVWAHIDDLQAQFKREYSGLIVRCKDAATITRLGNLLESDKKLQLEGKPHSKYYEDQNMGVLMLQAMAVILGIVMGVGAVFGAANTMFAAVASRTKEIATMRVLGFRAGSIWFSFTVEAAILGLAGGLLGSLPCYVVLNGWTTGTANWQTFSEVAFQFRVTPGLVATSTILAMVMAVVGGFLPAWRAARVPIAAALRGL